MEEKKFRIIQKDALPLSGFAGVVETQMVINPSIWKNAIYREDISFGFGDLIYLSNGYFKPNEGTFLHPHQDIDIVSVILDGKVGHEGTLGDGTVIKGPGVQVQRSGTGMQHSEFSLTNEKAHIIQIWFLPPKNGLKPAYQNFDFEEGKLTTVLGGKDTFNSNMICKVGGVKKDEKLSFTEDTIVLLTKGEAMIDNQKVKKDDLIEGKNFDLTTLAECNLVIISKNE